MNAIKTRLVGWLGGDRQSSAAATRGGRRPLVCEALEGRQLLNGAWMTQGSIPMPPIAAAPHAISHPTLSAAAQADLKALEADTQTFQAEIKARVPSSLFDALKTDAINIRKALGATASGWTGPHKDGHGLTIENDPSIDVPHSHHGFQGLPPSANVPMTGSTLSASLITKLETAGVSRTLIAQFATDAKALQTAIQKVDPALMARIQTERQTFEKDAPPPPSMHFDHILATATPSIAKVA